MVLNDALDRQEGSTLGGKEQKGKSLFDSIFQY